MQRRTSKGVIAIALIPAAVATQFPLTSTLTAQHPQVDELIAPKQTSGSLLDGYLNSSDDYTVGPTPSGVSAVKFYIKTYRAWNGITVDEQLHMFINVTSTSATQIKIDLDFDHTNLTPGIHRRIVVDKNLSTTTPCSNCVNLTNVTDAVDLGAPTTPEHNNPGPPWTVEIQISAQDLAINTIPRLVGFLMEVNTSTTTRYPFGADPAAKDTWAHLRSRNPVDFAMLLDHSGSMLATDGLSETRWTRATRATDMLAAALALFDDLTFNDRIGVAQYSWDCANDLSGDRTGSIPPSNPLNPPISTAWSPITSTPQSLTQGNAPPFTNNCTPIQRGLDYAINSQGGTSAVDDLERDRVVVLLSDGLHNIPSGHRPFDLNAATFQGKHQLVQVITVAMMLDSDAGTQLLDQISDAFRHPAFRGRYNIVTTFAALLQVYLQPLENLHAVNFIPQDGDGRYRPGQPDKLVFLAVWNSPSNATNLTVEHLNASDVVTTGLTITPFLDNTTGYAAAVVNSPPSGGSWRIVGPTGPGAPNAVYVLADLRIYAQFFVEQRRYSVGEPLLLTVDLKDRGQPLLSAEVTVSVDGPGMGLGNFLTTVRSDCTFAPPIAPGPVPLDSAQRTVAQTSGLARSIITPPDTLRTDPLLGRYRIAAGHFDRCGKDALVRSPEGEFQLRDDGLPPDVDNADGVYAYAFSPSEEGSYSFTFNVSGQTADGILFRRTYRLSDYAIIRPDAESTIQIIQKLPVQNGRQVAHVLLLFADSLGNYVGPGFQNMFKIRAVGAKLLNPLADLGNGYYRFTLDYSSDGPEPVVLVYTPDDKYEQQVDLSPPSRILIFLYRWASVLLTILLLLLLLLCYLTRRRARLRPET